MRPAGDLDQPRLTRCGFGFVEGVEPGVAVCVEEAPAGPKQRLGVLAPPVGRVAVEGCRWRPRSPGPLVADQRPESAGLGLAAARIEHRHGRVIGVQGPAGPGMAADLLGQGLQQHAQPADPVGQGRAVEIDTGAFVDLALAIERQASRAGGFHPRALPEPYVSLSAHTAPSIRP